MIRTCETCNRAYNDDIHSTICPHRGIGFCRRCDSVLCVCVTSPEEEKRRRDAILMEMAKDGPVVVDSNGDPVPAQPFPYPHLDPLLGVLAEQAREQRAEMDAWPRATAPEPKPTTLPASLRTRLHRRLFTWLDRIKQWQEKNDLCEVCREAVVDHICIGCDRRICEECTTLYYVDEDLCRLCRESITPEEEAADRVAQAEMEEVSGL